MISSLFYLSFPDRSGHCPRGAALAARGGGDDTKKIPRQIWNLEIIARFFFLGQTATASENEEREAVIQFRKRRIPHLATRNKTLLQKK